MSASDDHEGGGADVKDVPALGELDRCLEWEFPAGAVRVDAADAGDTAAAGLFARVTTSASTSSLSYAASAATAMLLIAEVGSDCRARLGHISRQGSPHVR